MISDNRAHADIGIVLYAAPTTKGGLGRDVDERADVNIVVNLCSKIDDAVAPDRCARAHDGTGQNDGAVVDFC